MAGRYMPLDGWDFKDFNPSVREVIENAANVDFSEIENSVDEVRQIAIPANALVVKAEGGDFSSLKSAIDSISDASSNNRRSIVVHGTITETQTVNAKDYVDVYFMEGSVLRNNVSSSSMHTVQFTNITDCKWIARVPFTAEIQRNNGGTAGNNYVINMTNAGNSGVSFLDGFKVTNNCSTSIRNYGLVTANCEIRNCSVSGNGTSRPYGIRIEKNSYLFNCEGYGGTGSVSADVPAGIISGNTSSGRAVNCRGFGGIGGYEAYGCWAFSYSDNPFIWENCIFYGGHSTTNAFGISAHKSATDTFINCVGVAGTSVGDNAAGIFCWGQPDNRASHMFINCVGIANVDNQNTSYGGYILDASRDLFDGCTFIGFATATGGQGHGLKIEIGADSISDTNVLRFTNCSIYGGGTTTHKQGSLNAQTAGNYGVHISKRGAFETMGEVEFFNCNFFGNDNSSPIFVDETAINYVRFYGGFAKSNGGENVVETNASEWLNARFYNMVMVGAWKDTIEGIIAGNVVGANNIVIND